MTFQKLCRYSKIILAAVPAILYAENEIDKKGAEAPIMQSYIEDGQWMICPEVSATRAGSVLDFSDLLDAPAGKYGRVTASGGKFIFSGKEDQPVRFNGTNFCFSASYLDKGTADKVVEELARTGFNVLRIHHHDNLLVSKTGNDSTELDPEMLDKLDYLFAACKKRGIYITTDLYVSRQVKEGEFPHLPYPLSIYQYKYLTLVDECIFDNLAKFTTNWLTHKNPYTGMTWAEDPALLGINCVNEGYIWMWGADDFIREVYMKRFEQYALKKHIMVRHDINDPAWPGFMTELYHDFQKRIFAVVRKTGYQGMLTDLNWIADLWGATFRRNYDYADTHLYHNHPTFPVKPWRMPAQVSPVSVLKSKPFDFSCVSPGRIFGKPYAITEWNMAFPHEGYADGATVAGALYAFQDYAMLCRFAWSHSKDPFEKPGCTINFFDSAADPVRRLSERISGALFLRGDVTPAKISFPLVLNEWRENFMCDNYMHSNRMSVLGDLALIGRSGVVFGDNPVPDDAAMIFRDKADMPEGKQKIKTVSLESARTQLSRLLPENVIRKDGQDVLISSTGELTLDRGNGIFKVVTPRSEAFILTQKGQSAEGAFASVKTKDSYVNFFVTSRDGKPLTSSKRLLLLHLTDAINSDLHFRKQNGLFYNWGKAPILMKKNTLTVTLKTTVPMTLYACGQDGQRLSEIAPKKCTPDGYPVFELKNWTGKLPAAAYEVVRQ